MMQRASAKNCASISIDSIQDVNSTLSSPVEILQTRALAGMPTYRVVPKGWRAAHTIQTIHTAKGFFNGALPSYRKIRYRTEGWVACAMSLESSSLAPKASCRSTLSGGISLSQNTSPRQGKMPRKVKAWQVGHLPSPTSLFPGPPDGSVSRPTPPPHICLIVGGATNASRHRPRLQ